MTRHTTYLTGIPGICPRQQPWRNGSRRALTIASLIAFSLEQIRKSRSTTLLAGSLLLFTCAIPVTVQAQETNSPDKVKTKTDSSKTKTIEREAGEDPLAAQSTALHEKKVKTETEPTKTETIEREAGEDPLAAQTTELHEKPGFWYRDHTSLKAYGSVRYRYATSDEESGFADGGSRAGLSGELQWKQGFWVLGRAEIGFNMFDGLSEVISASGRLRDSFDDIAARLLYAGLSSPSTTLSFGKNWSSYYQVSGLTDRFSDYGGEASGTYNALTDGGPTGTGRADRVFQGRFAIKRAAEFWNLKPFKLNVQYQPGEAIPQTDGFKYEHSAGFSALLETKNESFVGIAYNHAFIDETNLPDLKSSGIDGDAQALILGSRRFGDDYYMAMTLSWLENHETTDEGLYFDGWGWEAFASRRVAPKWWVIGGWNALTPHEDQLQAGDYRLRYAVIGVRYTFEDFRRMVYSEFRIDNSVTADGEEPGNIISVGVRWDLP